ncbi:hypothetical protein NA57DRAFT_33575 [Rhizodiscina lignyota]|uniref:GST N-terminal domain-containing protein n=1 Tax=Rhizodiscina lignyota TaxID=1504668 RepID=A0A9P4ILI1_9PEZI|nr:hypothetical protein NA57DRAFT_33575 [Rhizodiscina lignyota]
MASSTPPVVLFGYDSSVFTQKVRLCLRIKQIPYTYVTVPSMMPRPVLKDNFNLTYRKIPVLLIGRELYIDTSLIIEALEHFFSEGYHSLYPRAADGRDYRPIIRGFASYWTDRPFFRVTTGLIPPTVWNSQFGVDRANLIGHKLDPAKLGAKVTSNKSKLDMHLSILEPLFHSGGDWVFSAPTPSLADVALHYQLNWGNDMAVGRGLANLSGGELEDTNLDGLEAFFNDRRYPGLSRWFKRFKDHIDNLPLTETKVADPSAVLATLKSYEGPSNPPKMLPTGAPPMQELDEANQLTPGTLVSIAPDDTGRESPTLGTLLAISTEEIVIKPEELDIPARVPVNIHFPRIGFEIRPVNRGRL